MKNQGTLSMDGLGALLKASFAAGGVLKGEPYSIAVDLAAAGSDVTVVGVPFLDGKAYNISAMEMTQEDGLNISLSVVTASPDEGYFPQKAREKCPQAFPKVEPQQHHIHHTAPQPDIKITLDSSVALDEIDKAIKFAAMYSMEMHEKTMLAKFKAAADAMKMEAYHYQQEKLQKVEKQSTISWGKSAPPTSNTGGLGILDELAFYPGGASLKHEVQLLPMKKFKFGKHKIDPPKPQGPAKPSKKPSKW